MKLLFLCLFVGTCAWSQTNFFLTTNLVTADSNFREVSNQLYNVEKSVRFRDFQGRVIVSLTNGVLIEKFRKEKVYGLSRSSQTSAQSIGAYSSGPTRVEIGENEISEGKAFIRNYPHNEPLVTHSEISGAAIYVGTLDYNGETLKMFDYGLPHIVPVVTKHLISTNAQQNPK